MSLVLKHFIMRKLPTQQLNHFIYVFQNNMQSLNVEVIFSGKYAVLFLFFFHIVLYYPVDSFVCASGFLYFSIHFHTSNTFSTLKERNFPRFDFSIQSSSLFVRFSSSIPMVFFCEKNEHHFTKNANKSKV